MTPSMAGPGITLVNPPYPQRVMRRFVASYFAPNFLLPPTDLLYVAAAARRYRHAQTTVIDAVAKGYDTQASLAAIIGTRPDVIFLQLGFATLEADLHFCHALRKETKSRIVAMGYLPTIYPVEIMKRAPLDAVVRGEPEHVFCELLKAWAEDGDAASIPGVVVRQNGDVREGPPPSARLDFNTLPMPDHEAVDARDYFEVLMGGPLAAIFTARGCPYPCTFCVRTFGKKLSLRSADSVIEEVGHVVRDLGVRIFRFLDDTLTIEEERVTAICRGILDLAPLRWSALTRLDRVGEEMLELMARSGCRRLYLGLESGSQRMLDTYKKGLDLATIRRGMKLIRKSGIETTGFFIVGGPSETREDFEASVALAKETRLDYVIVTRLQYWPGTELFEKTEKELDTKLIPFAVRPRDQAAYDRALDREREFYRRFYLRPGVVIRRLLRFPARPRELVDNLVKLLRFILGRRRQDFI